MRTASIIRIILLTGLAIIAASGQVFAETLADTTEPLALRKIMQDLGKNMQTIIDGISREDWELVEKIALQVADHPQPPLVEKVRILSFAGSNVSKFKGYDGKTHDAARVLAEVAAEKDGHGVILAFSELQNTCLACHESFRKSFQAHFYGQFK
ncbi:cytochrome C [Methyloprofundus sedimenti]|uniref:Cytochrome C n=1 Tax=Methyloprofundus sedimenti TaxID=1420851 RepID=A0A1V8M9X1_9GAMM|nr:cytochrome c [Methyloprofundus sedimenti]OQK18404.1 cytochrome C [Methyloprofundus sedimenti]